MPFICLIFLLLYSEKAMEVEFSPISLCYTNTVGYMGRQVICEKGRGSQCKCTMEEMSGPDCGGKINISLSL
jgi:hypothetical protein